jgi:hypothetical protein
MSMVDVKGDQKAPGCNFWDRGTGQGPTWDPGGIPLEEAPEGS